MNKIAMKIQKKLSPDTDIMTNLEKLSNSELNSFLLELFRKKSQIIKPNELLQHFKTNRFVTPGDTDIIKLKEIELEFLKYAKNRSFQPIILSPLTPLGSCSSVGFVSQNNVVSGLRGTEIVSDASNVMAFQIAMDFKETSNKDMISRYVTTHRHVRAQYFTNPNFSSHFSAFCLASGGYDKGNFKFEISQLIEHLGILLNLLETKFDNDNLYIKFYLKTNSEKFPDMLQREINVYLKDKKIKFLYDFDNQYYKTCQFKIFLKIGRKKYDLADGGIVDWTQKLLENRKHRLMISGIGLELVNRLLNF